MKAENVANIYFASFTESLLTVDLWSMRPKSYVIMDMLNFISVSLRNEQVKSTMIHERGIIGI